MEATKHNLLTTTTLRDDWMRHLNNNTNTTQTAHTLWLQYTRVILHSIGVSSWLLRLDQHEHHPLFRSGWLLVYFLPLRSSWSKLHISTM